MRRIVNRIIPFSSVDGPGNRTAVFLQGCNIDCKYCHNPETRRICNHCGVCIHRCPAGALERAEDGTIIYKRELCVLCDTCIHVCPYGSSPRVEVMSPEEVMAAVRRQIPFIRGITVSGGECMLCPEFLTELFTLAKREGLGTLIDSNGTVPFREHPALMSCTDGVMLDIKAFRPEDHMAITGMDNRTVLENALYLGKLHKLEEVRCVIVPDLYDVRESIRLTAEFLKPVLAEHPFRFKLIAFRPNGVRPEFAGLRVPKADLMRSLAEYLRQLGFPDVVIT